MQATTCATKTLVHTQSVVTRPSCSSSTINNQNMIPLHCCVCCVGSWSASLRWGHSTMFRVLTEHSTDAEACLQKLKGGKLHTSMRFLVFDRLSCLGSFMMTIKSRAKLRTTRRVDQKRRTLPLSNISDQCSLSRPSFM